MKHKIILSILLLVFSFTAHSGPARRDPVIITQPDGTTFNAKVRGDEFMKIITTDAGHAIIRDKDRWWCYARYDAEAGKVSTGHRVGHAAPSEVLAMSMRIPFERLTERAKTRRAAMNMDKEPLMPRILKRNGISTKNGEGKTVTKHGLIILAQFKDEKFTYTREDFVNMLTRSGYNNNGATGSAKEYFDSQFNGSIEFSFDVSEIVTLSRNVAYYGENDKNGNDKNPHMMVIEACELVDDAIDFSLYDDDGDNVVDNVFVFFAGGDEADGAGDDRIWSHAWYIYSGADEKLIVDGKMIDSYACTSELSRRGRRDVLTGIGTFCHEYSHTFNLPDMYDTDYDMSGGTADGLWGSTSLMDAGNQNNYFNTPPNFNAIEREILGISEPVVITANGGYTLSPINKEGRSYRLDTDNPDEYFLLECRVQEGWDKYTGGHGMLVYHIDKSDRFAGESESYTDNSGEVITARDRWNIYNEVNCRPDHQCADLIEANASAYDVMGVFFPAKGADSLLPEREDMKYWSGGTGEISITNIRETEDGIAFNVLGFSESELPPAVATYRKEEFADAAIIQFESDREFEGEAVAEWGRTAGGETETVRIKPYQPGKYAITLENLEPGNKTYTIKIHFELDGIVGEITDISLMTKRKPSVKWPFIYMGGVKKNEDGTLPAGSKLPLRVYNAEDAAEVKWTFNNSEVRTGGDGYFTVSQKGVLKVHVVWEDGSEEIVMKEIIIGEEDMQ